MSIETIPRMTSHDEAEAEKLFQSRRDAQFKKMDGMFVYLMIGQWIFAVLMALFLSPYGWEGKQKVFHTHLYLALFTGGGMALFPVLLAKFRPGWVVTRHVIALTQILFSALFIHLSGGRIETHFHVFGSLAFLAFYYDWTLLLNATLVVVADHLLRGVLYPESVYGIVNPEWWRFLEHAFWVVFEDIILVWSCVTGVKSMREFAHQRAEMGSLLEGNQLKAAALEMTLAEVQAGRRE